MGCTTFETLPLLAAADQGVDLQLRDETGLATPPPLIDLVGRGTPPSLSSSRAALIPLVLGKSPGHRGTCEVPARSRPDPQS